MAQQIEWYSYTSTSSELLLGPFHKDCITGIRMACSLCFSICWSLNGIYMALDLLLWRESAEGKISRFSDRVFLRFEIFRKIILMFSTFCCFVSFVRFL